MCAFQYNFCKTVEKLIIKTIWISLVRYGKIGKN